MAGSIVETSIGKVKVWALDHEYPDSRSSVGIVTVAGEPHKTAPAPGEPPYLRVDVDLCRRRWQLTFGWVRYADALLVVDPKQAEKERKDYKAWGRRDITIRTLPMRSPLRHELAEVAATWAAAHREAFEQERRETYLGIFDFSVERLAAVLEEMVSTHKSIGPVLVGAERVGLVTAGRRNITAEAVKALAGAIAAAKEARRLFAVAKNANGGRIKMSQSVDYQLVREHLQHALDALSKATLSDQEVCTLLEMSDKVAGELERPDKDSTHH